VIAFDINTDSSSTKFVSWRYIDFRARFTRRFRQQHKTGDANSEHRECTRKQRLHPIGRVSSVCLSVLGVTAIDREGRRRPASVSEVAEQGSNILRSSLCE